MLQALRIRDFRLIWGGGLVSSLGSWLLVLAIPAHVFLVTGSLRATGLTLAAEYFPLLLLGPAAGVLTDRQDRRRLMIGANLFCAAAVAAMLLGTSPERYWVLYVALIAENSGIVLLAPAWRARLPAIVGTGSLLSSANSLSSLSSGAVRLIGGPLGGILLTVYGVKWLICADALSYLLAAAAAFLSSRADSEHSGRKSTLSGVLGDLRQGWRVLRNEPVTRALLPVMTMYLAANASLSSVLIPFGVLRLGGSEHTGYLLACLGIGFLLGAPIVRAGLDRVQPRYLLSASLAATAVAYLLLFSSSSLDTALPAAVGVGMFGSMALVIPQTAIQRAIPGSVLGRVSSVFMTGEAAATLAGAGGGPFLAQAASLTGVAAAASLVTAAAAALTFLLVPQLTSIIPAQAHHEAALPGEG
jgi:predicted MFS family arabinose efflux permease